MKFNFRFKNTFFIWFIISLFVVSCNGQIINKSTNNKTKSTENPVIKVGANQLEKYEHLLKGKNFAIVANQTSLINNDTHLVDYLHQKFPKSVQKVFAPEHGFRGKADAGEHIKDGIDKKTNLPIISLYGDNKKPHIKQLENINTIVFDIQDVGVRFYTYISTLHYVMEACAEENISLIVLDRPNPNAHYVDGPMLEKEHASFVGLHPVPLVYGMTIGEYAQMINGEKWLKNGIKCDLTIVQLQNYTHNTPYTLPVKPSPNLPNDLSIQLYPSLAFFEGTNVSCGRGTEMQFQLFGSPFLPKEKFSYTFTPTSNFGAKYPKHQNEVCFGIDLSKEKNTNSIQLKWLTNAYQNTKDKNTFFNAFFTKLAGTKKLQKQIEANLTYPEISKSWKKDLEKFQLVRVKYLLYK